MAKPGDVIKKIRKQRGLKQADLARMISKPRQYIHGVERNHYVPKYRNMAKLADALGTTVDAIYGK